MPFESDELKRNYAPIACTKCDFNLVQFFGSIHNPRKVLLVCTNCKSSIEIKIKKVTPKKINIVGTAMIAREIMTTTIKRYAGKQKKEADIVTGQDISNFLEQPDFWKLYINTVLCVGVFNWCDFVDYLKAIPQEFFEKVARGFAEEHNKTPVSNTSPPHDFKSASMQLSPRLNGELNREEGEQLRRFFARCMPGFENAFGVTEEFFKPKCPYCKKELWFSGGTFRGIDDFYCHKCDKPFFLILKNEELIEGLAQEYYKDELDRGKPIV